MVVKLMFLEESSFSHWSFLYPVFLTGFQQEIPRHQGTAGKWPSLHFSYSGSRKDAFIHSLNFVLNVCWDFFNYWGQQFFWHKVTVVNAINFLSFQFHILLFIVISSVGCASTLCFLSLFHVCTSYLFIFYAVQSCCCMVAVSRQPCNTCTICICSTRSGFAEYNCNIVKPGLFS